MKKLSILFLMAFVSFTAAVSAQEEEETTTTGGVEQFTNKNGFAVLPEAGSFAIGFDALPFLRFAGNMFNANTSNGISANFANQGGAGIGGTLYGKYFLSETTAIRGRFSINQSTVQDVNRVILDGQAVPQNNIEVEDELVNSNFGLNLGGGMEFRRGKGRLMGVYGAEAMIGLNTSNEKYTYGNAITAGNQTPTTSNYGNNIFGDSRVISRTNANSFSLSAMGFAGVEYFFAPQISIGAEFTLGLRYTGTNRSEVVREEWEANSNTLINVSDVDANILTNFGIATGVWGGSINLMFHF
jgi:hypothetical protein